MSTAERLRAAREALGLTQTELVARSGIPIDTYKKYEGGSRQPGGDAVAGIVRAGINANWLLTGEGPMLIKDLPASAGMRAEDSARASYAAAPASAGIDTARLQLAIATVEEALAEAGRVMAPDRKAELVLAVYELYQEPANTRERVLKLVKLAA